MAEPAVNLAPVEEEAAQEAARQTTRLIVIEGGGEGAAATEGAAGAEIGEGLLAAAGTTVAAIAAGLLILLWPSEIAPEPTIGSTPNAPSAPEPNPFDSSQICQAENKVKGKPVELDDRIPEERRKLLQKEHQERRDRDCQERQQDIERRTNRRRKKPGKDIQGMRYRYWDMICSAYDPATGQGSKIWDDHEQAYENDRAGLQNKLDEFEEKCEGDLPEGAKEYADKDFPDKSEWRGNTPECEQYRQERQDWYDAHKSE